MVNGEKAVTVSFLTHQRREIFLCAGYLHVLLAREPCGRNRKVELQTRVGDGCAGFSDTPDITRQSPRLTR